MLKYLIPIFVTAAPFCAAVNAQAFLDFRPNPQAITFLKYVVRDDLNSYLEGEDSLYQYNLPKPPVADVTALQLRQAYFQDLKVRAFLVGNLVHVRGSVRSVGTELDGRPYLRLATSYNDFEDVRATLAGPGSMLGGQSADLLCICRGNEGPSVRLDTCQDFDVANGFYDSQHQVLPERMSDQIDRWFLGKGVPDFVKTDEGVTALFSIYWSVTQPSVRKVCQASSISKECLAKMKETLAKYRVEYLAAYNSARSFLHLPAPRQ